jgi:hypothetical protein
MYYNLKLLDNSSKNIPVKIDYLYEKGWNIKPENHKWIKNRIELSLNEAYCIEIFNNYHK